MGTLTIDFRILDDFENSAGRVLTSLNDRLSDYSGIERGVAQVSTPRGNLDQSNYYLKKKEQILKNHAETISAFKGKVFDFVSGAEQADKRVAEHVRESTDAFQALTGIQVARGGLLASISENLGEWWEQVMEPIGSTILEGVRGVCDTVKAFYEEHKMLIDAVVSTVLFAAAVVAVVAATGGAGLFFAGVGAYQAGAELLGNWLALGHTIAGNYEDAERWSNFDGRTLVSNVGGTIDDVFGTDFMEESFNFVYSGISLAAAVYSIGKTGKDAFKSFDFKNQGLKALTEKKTWAGVTKEIIGIDGKMDLDDADDIIKIKNIASRLGVTEDTAIRLLDGSAGVNNIKTVVEATDKVITGGYKAGNEQIATVLEVTSVGDDLADGFENIEKMATQIFHYRSEENI